MERAAGKRDGFSLIEVIVAVAILAILSMPILLYFTHSAIRSARGRFEQAADMAAQSVVEELDAVEGFDSIEEKLTQIKDSSGTILWNKAQIAANVNGKTKLNRKLTMNINGEDYHYAADVVIDYPNNSTYYKTSSLTPDKVQYNNYRNPHFQELHSDSSVVIAEMPDAYDIGVSDIYFQLNGSAPTVSGGEPAGSTGESVSLDTIKKNLRRVFVINAKDDPGNDSSHPENDVVVIQAGYKFIYEKDGTTVGSEVALKNSKVEKSKLKNIYFLFKPLWANVVNLDNPTGIPAETKESAEMDFSAITFNNTYYMLNEEKLSVSFIKQSVKNSSGAIVNDPGKTIIEFPSTYKNNSVRFYCNGGLEDGVRLPNAIDYNKSTTGEDVSFSSSGGVPSLVKEEINKRIAKVTIKIFDESSYYNGTDEEGKPKVSENPGTPLATIETTISI